MPLKLNNVEISNSITSFNKKQREVLEFTFTDGISPIDNVYLKIIKMPVSINNPAFNKKWDNGTNDGVTIDTTTDTELHLILEGTYNIEVTETYVSGVIRKRMVIIEAISLNNNLGIPFPGESLETNSADGWARKVEKSIQELSQNGSAVSVIGQHNTIPHIKTDVVCISDVIDTDNSSFFYEISTPGELIGVPVKQLGIVIDRWETGSAETFDPEIIYKVAFSGSFYVGSGFFHVGGVYYNETTNQLTNDPSDTPVGYYINNILYIEFPISIGTVHNDMLGRDASNAHPANTIELDDTGFTGFLSGKSIDEVEKLANEIDDAVGREDGIASLDWSGKLPVSQLPISVMEYKGVWDANTNTPTLTNGDGDGTNGDVWVCTVAGTVDFGSGDIDFFEGDWAVYNGAIWEKSSHQGSDVFESDGEIIKPKSAYQTKGFVIGSDIIDTEDLYKFTFNKLDGSLSTGNFHIVGHNSTAFGDGTKSGYKWLAIDSIVTNTITIDSVHGDISADFTENDRLIGAETIDGDWNKWFENMIVASSIFNETNTIIICKDDITHTSVNLITNMDNNNYQSPNSITEGSKTIASGENSHAQGEQTIALKKNSSTKGRKSQSNNLSSYAHASNALVTIGDSQNEVMMATSNRIYDNFYFVTSDFGRSIFHAPFFIEDDSDIFIPENTIITAIIESSVIVKLSDTINDDYIPLYVKRTLGLLRKEGNLYLIHADSGYSYAHNLIHDDFGVEILPVKIDTVIDWFDEETSISQPPLPWDVDATYLPIAVVIFSKGDIGIEVKKDVSVKGTLKLSFIQTTHSFINEVDITPL